jgi:ABC-type transport system involved in multi-copper enzyme maturation permease subunit
VARITSILRAANPVSALFGPIFQKEVRTAGRKRSTYILRSLYCLGLLAILIAAFIAFRSATNARSAVMHLQSMQKLAPTLTLVVAWFQFVLLFFTAPVLAAGSISEERRARSLDVLMTTPMTAWQIILGKLSSRIVQIIILALLAAPALLAVRIFGGLSAEVILAASCVSVSTAILGAALAVLFSMRQKKATMAALFGLLSLLLLQCGPGMAEGIRYHLANQWVVESPYRTNILATCAPVTLLRMSEAVESGQSLPRLKLEVGKPPGPKMAPPLADLGPVWLVNTMYNIVLAALVTFYTGLALRRAMKCTESREGLLGGAATLPRRKSKAAPVVDDAEAPVAEAPATPESAQERFRSRERRVSDNPVLWREVRQPTFGSRILFRIVAALTVASLLLLYWLAGMDNVGLHGALAFIGIAAILFQAVFLTSGPFAGEREARTWDVLLTTTMTPGQILRGKLLGVLRGFWFIPFVVVIHFTIAASIGYVRPIGVLYLIAIYTGPALLFSATGLFLSLRFRKAVTAGALNLVLAFSLWGLLWFTPLITPMVLRVVLLVPAQLGWLSPDLVVDDFLDSHLARMIDGIYALNPVALVDTAISPCILESIPRTAAGPFETRLIQHKLTMSDCTWVVLGVFVFYTTAAAAFVGLARARFRLWSGRAS